MAAQEGALKTHAGMAVHTVKEAAAQEKDLKVLTKALAKSYLRVDTNRRVSNPPRPLPRLFNPSLTFVQVFPGPKILM
jgi:hypothetical protein